MFDFFKPKTKGNQGPGDPFIRTLATTPTDTAEPVRSPSPTSAAAVLVFPGGRTKSATLAQPAPTPVPHEPLAASPTSHTSADLGVRLAQREITRSEELAEVPYYACINKELELAAHLYSSVSVLSIDASGRDVVLLLSSAITPDQVAALKERLSIRGKTLSQTGPQAWICTTPLILSVSNGDISPRQTSAVRAMRADNRQSSLWESFKEIVQWGYDQGANDVDFVVSISEPTSRVYFKIDGRYLTLERWALPTDTMMAMLGIAWQQCHGGASAKFEPRQEQQSRIEIDLKGNQRVRLRWASMATDKGTIVTMRVQRLGLSSVVRSLAEAGYLDEQIEIFERVIRSKGGLTTLAGTVGSGKSVTLAILMSLLPPHVKGVTFEDPVEIDMPLMHQKTINRDLVVDDDKDFQGAVRTLFRSALDVFLMGEVRDVATGRVVRAVLESGHSTYTTTHAASALGIINKYASPQVGIPLDVLGTPGMLRLNVYQALLLKTCPHCGLSSQELSERLTADARHAHQQMMGHIEELYALDSGLFKFRNEPGCEHCRRPGLPALSGYAGRTVVAEMVEPDEALCERILAADKVGLVRAWRSLSDGVVTSTNLAGKTAMEVALLKAARGEIDPREIELHFDSFATLASKARAQRAASQRRSALAGAAPSPFAGLSAPPSFALRQAPGAAPGASAPAGGAPA